MIGSIFFKYRVYSHISNILEAGENIGETQMLSLFSIHLAAGYPLLLFPSSFLCIVDFTRELDVF